ncbi:MAG: hypothetical protein ACOZAN_01905 [Patescibacteria group bacterium]
MKISSKNDVLAVKWYEQQVVSAIEEWARISKEKGDFASVIVSSMIYSACAEYYAELLIYVLLTQLNHKSHSIKIKLPDFTKRSQIENKLQHLKRMEFSRKKEVIKNLELISKKRNILVHNLATPGRMIDENFTSLSKEIEDNYNSLKKTIFEIYDGVSDPFRKILAQ